MSADSWTLPLATEVFLEAFRTLVDGEEDDREVPIGRLLSALATELGIKREIDEDWYCTAGELRARTRDALAALAAGETP